MAEKKVPSKQDLLERLTPEQYRITQEAGTEPPFSGGYDGHKEAGMYHCVCCGRELFSSGEKYDSGSGWPSFWSPNEGRVATKIDYWLIIPRTEYHCVRCGGHQGHLFGDGPPPTGKRWCNNGLALQFVPSGKPLPELRS